MARGKRRREQERFVDEQNTQKPPEMKNEELEAKSQIHWGYISEQKPHIFHISCNFGFLHLIHGEQLHLSSTEMLQLTMTSNRRQ